MTYSGLKKTFIVLCIALLIVWALYGGTRLIKDEKKAIYMPFLEQKVLDFARKYAGQDVIVVSKKDHLLYYCREGRIVTNEVWRGFTYNFPVRVALANRWHYTPEGEMYIDGKNSKSKYIRFLSFSGPGAYGIHSAATKFAGYLDRMERKNPNFLFATLKDDTRGCVQVENRIIKYLFAKVDLKTPVLVMP